MRELLGITDSPIERIADDAFQVGGYVKALSDFISECDTPMTIAIQGDWGTGKTSMMKMVEEALGDTVISVWFNTWQFSQFNMQDSLTITFLQSVMETLQSKTGVMLKETRIKDALYWVKTAAVLGTSVFSDTVAGKLDKTFSNSNNLIKSLNNLRDDFQKLVYHVCQQNKRSRIVVFVDDLDRLFPVKAVEILEVMKTFLDCKDCIFILAIDTSVVYQGINDKFGGNLSDLKKQDFFDKIIQMPFIMPVGHYKLDNYINELLKNILFDIPANTNDDLIDLIELIINTANENPRSIKRILNSFALSDKMAQHQRVYNSDLPGGFLSQRLLLIMQCLQLHFDYLYSHILRKASKNELHEVALSTKRCCQPVRDITSDLLKGL